ncbi:hypothetical protein Leryth_027320 [Lithospermum erythrorhizon]|uniref:Secondary carrier transporter n=1 Tax=Lithospermum erythrorhizon TaxID=34254 RepID=A0AAV3PCV4_LITER|nr:hypothetical protein Leryth_027320 [Lithospermum erythrorhizon]
MGSQKDTKLRNGSTRYDDESGYSSESRATTYRKMITVASVAAGVQFGWALQLSLLTPYVQLLGVPHMWASFVWLCGPVSGLLVQPIVGYFSDSSTSRFGKRRPYIVAGAVMVILSVVLIGFAADFGHMAGDSLDGKVKTRAVAIFVVGFWVLDVANNTLQGPLRAFLADICNDDMDLAKSANAFCSFFMGVGNILGYSAGSYGKLYTVLPFTKTAACDTYCANLKTCFIFSICLLLCLTLLAVLTVGEKPQDIVIKSEPESPFLFFISLGKAIKQMQRPMWILLAVTCMNWLAWFPWLLYNTDWMGKEVFGGDVGEPTYALGVQTGSLGLMLNSVILMFISIAIVFVSGGGNGVKIMWAVSNFLMVVCFLMTLWITKTAEHRRKFDPQGLPLPPSANIKAGALAIFSLLGASIAVTFSVPFAMASMYCMSSTDGPGQGLSIGVLNLAIVTPQMFVSVTSGPWSALFGGGNVPVFYAGAGAALLCGLMALFILPTPPKGVKAIAMGGGGH